MEKVYTIATYRVVLNVIYGICWAGLVWGVVLWFTNNMNYAIIAGAIILLLHFWLIIRDKRIKITITATHIIISKGGEEEHFEIEKCGFRAYTTTSNGDTECVLYIDYAEGKEYRVDCELIGEGQFLEILEDLKITGDQSPITKLETK